MDEMTPAQQAQAKRVRANQEATRRREEQAERARQERERRLKNGNRDEE